MHWPWNKRPPAPFSLEGMLERLSDVTAAAAAMAEAEKPRTLKEHAERVAAFGCTYGAACRFKAGDVVTPRAGGPLHGEGWPHIVLEVFESPFRYFPDTNNGSASIEYGARFDMRVLHENADGIIHAHVVESWLFDDWAPADVTHD